MEKSEMGYFEAVGPEAVKEWNAYREKLIAYKAALIEFVKELGATRYCEAFGGGVLSLEELPPVGNPYRGGFSYSRGRNGGFYARSKKPRQLDQQEAYERFKERNERVAALRPSTRAIAAAHGFVTSLRYDDGQGQGSRGLGGFHGVQACWYAPDGPVVLWAPDVTKEIASTKRTWGEQTVTDPVSWAVPEGYKQITKVEYDYRAAKAAYERELQNEKEEGE